MASVTFAVIILCSAWLVGYACKFDARRIYDTLLHDETTCMWSDTE
ncbi:MAG: hypothetical protein K2W95_10965 [Candidatus Obscuribacterales bacterium]|nr:hypothetical protein [Candidatus Obscuribacterales bacterium]